MKKMFLFLMFIGFAVTSNAQFLIDQTYIYSPQTSSSGFEPYKWVKSVDQYGTHTANTTNIQLFKFEGNTIFTKPNSGSNALLFEYRYGNTSNGQKVYYLDSGGSSLNYDMYIIMSDDRSIINMCSQSNHSTIVYKRGTGDTNNLIE